jgi:hypothetical protein
VRLSSSSYASIIEVLFGSAEFFPFVLQQQLTFFDFLSYCGGSLGLFLGFSTLSAIEICYYFSLRLIFVRNQKKKVDIEDSSDAEKKRNYLMEILESSSIHGFNQIVMRKRHVMERFVKIHWFDQSPL